MCSNHLRRLYAVCHGSFRVNWEGMRVFMFGSIDRVKFRIMPGGGGALVFEGGYHPRKTTFKKHPKHVFFQV